MTLNGSFGPVRWRSPAAILLFLSRRTFIGLGRFRARYRARARRRSLLRMTPWCVRPTFVTAVARFRWWAWVFLNRRQHRASPNIRPDGGGLAIAGHPPAAPRTTSIQRWWWWMFVISASSISSSAQRPVQVERDRRSGIAEHGLHPPPRHSSILMQPPAPNEND